VNDRVVAFDINAAQVASAAPLAMRAAQPAPAPPPGAGRTAARAQLASVYAAVLGSEIAVPDLVERLQLGGTDARPALPELAGALAAHGLTARVEAIAAPLPAHWPALAEMTPGQIVLVLSQEGEALQIYDPTCPGNRAEVALADFAQVYAGRLLRAAAPMAALEARHSAAARPRHWFWGEFAGYRRQLAEVGAASLVANLLAVAVSLFSMQVFTNTLGGGMSSRLFQEVREKRGLCYSVYAFHWGFSDTGIFGIHAATGQSDIAELVPVIVSELQKTGEHITQEELDRARAQYRAGLVMSAESAASRASQIARQILLFGRPIPKEELVERLSALTVDRLTDLSGRLFSTRPTIAAVGPIGSLAAYDAIRDALPGTGPAVRKLAV